MANKKKTTNISDVVNDLISRPAAEPSPVAPAPVAIPRPLAQNESAATLPLVQKETVITETKPQVIKRGYLLPIDVVDRFRLCSYLHQSRSASAHVAQALTEYMDRLGVPKDANNIRSDTPGNA